MAEWRSPKRFHAHLSRSIFPDFMGNVSRLNAYIVLYLDMRIMPSYQTQSEALFYLADNREHKLGGLLKYFLLKK